MTHILTHSHTQDHGHSGHDDHDLGFAHDLPRMLGRRRLLAMMGGLGMASLSGLPAAALEACTALPWETAGPYPGDGTNVKDGQTVNALTQEGVIRTDITTSFGDYEGVVTGMPLDLELTLENAEGCTALEGYAIYLWHCNAEGHYSLYDETDANWLRGVGVSDAEGKVRFTTIVPGCYDGRWPHMHFEVFENVEAAVSGKASILTSQIAMPEADVARIYEKDSGEYTASTANLGRISISADNVFGDNSADEIAQQTLAMAGSVEDGYTGTVTIAIDFDADRTLSMPTPPEGGMDGDVPPPPNE